MSSLSGKITEIIVEYAGSTLAGDHAGGEVVLTLADVIDFDESGGHLLLDGETLVAYVSSDEAVSTVTLESPTGGPLDDGAPILLSPLAPEVTASVSIDHESGDVIEGVLVPHHLVPLLQEGVREPDQAESVEITSQGDGRWIVSNVLGRPTQITSEIRLPHSTNPYDLVLKDGRLAFTDSGTDNADAEMVLQNNGLHLAAGGNTYLVLDNNFSYLRGQGSLIIDASDVHVSNLGDPTDPQDAATKAYVDANASSAPKFLTVGLTGADQSIANGVATPTVVAFDTTVNSEGLSWAFSSQNRLWIDANAAGVYEMLFNMAWRPNTTGNRRIGIYVNGGSIIQSWTYSPSTSGVFSQSVASEPIRLAAGDYVDFRVAQLSGGSLAVVGTTGYLTKASIKRIGD